MPHVCFVLHPRFQMLAYVFACETLRIANKRAGRSLFTWETRTASAEPAEASNGRLVEPDVRGWGDGAKADLILVLAGYDPLALHPPGLGRFLRRAAGGGSILGGVDTGVAVLAFYGLLAGHRVVVHHEAQPGFRETWPEIEVIDAIYHFDGRRLSSAGGTATGDAILAWIASAIGPEFADEVAEDMIHGSLRPAAQSQRPRDTADPTLQAMRMLMLSHLEEPLAIAEIAARLNLSQKRLRGLCQRVLRRSPSEYYLSLRLQHARALLSTTRLPITEIAVATGFGSHAGFSRTYRQVMGVCPRETRSR